MGSSIKHDDGTAHSDPSSNPDPPSDALPDQETVVSSIDASVPTGDSSRTESLPEEFGRYRILRPLGRGGMGAVYLAHDSQLDRDVALKVPHFGDGATPDVLERFYREARAMGTLRHPNLCPVYDVGEHDGVHFLTMAYIEGTELSRFLEDLPEGTSAAAGGGIDPVELVRKVALALAEAHRMGVIHRDLKPSNIMIDGRGEPVVMDFGLARRERSSDSDITRDGAIVGTPSYMPPEQIQSGSASVGPTADVYSLGVILYRLVCGRLPYEGDVLSVLSQVMTKEPPRPSEFCDHVDPLLEAICLRAMQKSPDDRIASMSEFAEALDALRAAPELSRARARRREAAERAAIVPGCRHDVFVSYCPLDDEPPPGVDAAGWVTTLVDNLDWRLRQLSGSREGPSVWLNLENANDVADVERLDDSATVVMVASPAYARSACWSEGLLGALQRRHLGDDRVFLVELEHVEHAERPAAIQALRGCAFWRAGAGTLGYPHPRPDVDLEYYARIDDLARAIHTRLERLTRRPTLVSPQTIVVDAPGSESADASTITTAISAGSVFLAEVTDDLDPLRDEVGRYLNQHGFNVLPKTWYPRDPAEFVKELERDLSGCLSFVQLLGPFAGKKPPGSTAGYPCMQHEAAVRSGAPVMQWRPSDLDPHSLADREHRSLVEGVDVQAVDLEQFKREVVRRTLLERERREASDSSVDVTADKAFVFINVERGDLPLADELCDILDRDGFSYALPLHDGRPDEIRLDLEANLLDCDGLIVVYGHITEQWVREQLRQWRKVLYRREKPLRGLAVFEGPPPEKQRLGMKLPKMHVIDCREGLEEGRIRDFLNALAEG